LTVNQAASAVAIVSSLNPSGYRAGVYFSASLPTDATGNVTFLTNGIALNTTNLIAGVANSLTITNLPRGTNIITVQYLGDNNYIGSTNSLAQGVTNHPPVATSAVYSRNINSIKIFTSNLFSNFCSDVDGDTLTVTGLGVSTNGITISSNPSFLGYINTNTVNDQFVYIISDGYGGSATNIVYVNFIPFISGQNGTTVVTNGTASLKFFGIPNYRYGIQRSTNFTDWATIWITNAPVSGGFGFTDTFGDLGGNIPTSAFYRLEWNP